MEQNSFLNDVDEQIYQEPASVGQRFANYLVDAILFYVIIFLLGLVLFASGAADVNNIDNNVLVREDGQAVLLQYLFWLVVFVGYYTILEGATKGRTIGKFITRTKVVNEDGSDIGWKQAFIRSLCRLVPFEPFSTFGGTPWHDKWAGTKVIKIK